MASEIETDNQVFLRGALEAHRHSFVKLPSGDMLCSFRGDRAAAAGRPGASRQHRLRGNHGTRAAGA